VTPELINNQLGIRVKVIFKNKMRKISELTIENFKGITAPIFLRFNNIKFQNNADICNAVIIFGDNASGKSSIVDALEVALREKLLNKKLFDENLTSSPELAPLFGKREGRIKIKFDDKDINILDRIINYDLKTISGNSPDDFKKFSFVLRRKNITSFWDLHESKRQLIILDFFKDLENQKDIPTVNDLEGIITDISSLKKERVDIIGLIITEINLKYSSEQHFFENTKLDEIIKKHLEVTHDVKNRKIDKNLLQEYFSNSTIDIINKLKFLNQQLKDLNKKKKTIENPVKKNNFEQQLTDFLHSISKDVTDDFICYSSLDYIKDIQIVLGEQSSFSLSFIVEMNNGQKISPQKVFSEANLDLLAIIVYLNIAKKAPDKGQSKVMVLDDIFQSIDSEVRISIIQYICTNFKDWQIFYTVHDKLWYTLLSNELGKNKITNRIEYRIYNWNYEYGPTIHPYFSNDLIYYTDVIMRTDANDLLSIFGRLQERIYNELTYIFELPIPRKPEKDIKLNDMLSELKKYLSNSNISDIINDLDTFYRNLGSHDREYKYAIDDFTAKKYAKQVLKLYQLVYCFYCFCWISKGDSRKYIYNLTTLEVNNEKEKNDEIKKFQNKYSSPINRKNGILFIKNKRGWNIFGYKANDAFSGISIESNSDLAVELEKPEHSRNMEKINKEIIILLEHSHTSFLCSCKKIEVSIGD
jgi:hypothetical protein